ncbi:MAG: hypothetical protein MI807_21205 [Verrucomicrobiales bacterium]|nr:hypothetical protein [Verrucomicrobiales bacterium]
MKMLIALSSLCLIAILSSSCESTGNAGSGPGYYAPAPESTVDRTAKLQQGMGSIHRSGIR